jgi:hypothetical protein
MIYVLAFAGLFLSSAGLYLRLDRRLTPALGRLGILGSGTWHRASANVVRKVALQDSMDAGDLPRVDHGARQAPVTTINRATGHALRAPSRKSSGLRSKAFAHPGLQK